MDSAPRERDRFAAEGDALDVAPAADGDPEIPPPVEDCLSGRAGVSALDSKVLVLNKLYLAVRVISARRAFCLIARDHAEVIHLEAGRFSNFDMAGWLEVSQLAWSLERSRHDWVRTVRLRVAVPRIIRLLRFDRQPAMTVKLNRRNLLARDAHQCQYCGRHFPTPELSLDHVVPRIQGGGESWENLVTACIRCNARKGGRTPDQAGMKLLRAPRRPKRSPLITSRLVEPRYESWKVFLESAPGGVELN